MILIMLHPLIDSLRHLPSDLRHYAAGDQIFRQSDDVQVIHLIEVGQVHLIRHQIKGFSLTLQRASAGAILAEASLFSQQYHCDAIAVGAVSTAAIAKSVIRAEMARSPQMAETWASYLAREVQTARLRDEILVLRTVAERLDAWISLHDGHIPAKGEQKTVAAEIGVSAEALYREFARRRRQTQRKGL